MVGYLFAGQGSQYVGMGKDLYESFPEAAKVFDRAEELLGFELKKACFDGPEEKLKSTDVSQPAIVTVSIAAFEVFKARSNLVPSFVAGLSLGEYSALIAAGALTFDNGIRLIRRRGQLMEEASRKHPGRMAAVLELHVEEIKEICLKSGAEIANLNCPGQIVITGKAEAVSQAMELCSQAGAKKVIPLEVSGGFHSTLMFEASVELKLVLDNISISEPKVPVVSNYTAQPQYKVSQIIENLVYQIRSSVRWEDSMRFMLSNGVMSFIEFGPGKILKGLMRRIDSNAKVTNIEVSADIEQAIVGG
ncbi:MAG: ACP S-malonyltransferase [Candidatus Omnitrophica bacterium]|nr:ACP S-malonyltransferase [Candidatus Omnitrophota bacterium]MBU1924053.1 ACP S-malonyltransferase [Candidatus Omnitrophota bacterium]